MISKRLKTIASLIENTDFVLDIGTDHAYLPIYLIQNHLTDKVICTDINDIIVKKAKDNIKKANLNIEVIKSDGLKNVLNHDINTIVMAGMGTHTIINILKDINNFDIKKLILSSNNNLPMLRSYLQTINYTIAEEISIKDKNNWYVIIKAIKVYKKLTCEEIQIGVFNSANKEYYYYLFNKYLKLANYKRTELDYLNKYLNKLE